MNSFYDELKDGFYNIDVGKDGIVLSFEEEEKHDFPSWKKIYDSTMANTYIGDFDFSRRNVYLNSHEIGKFILKSNSIIDIRFLKDMSGYAWECYFLSHDKAIRFVSVQDGIEAIIMPMMKE
jgi:hypothetical protein